MTQLNIKIRKFKIWKWFLKKKCYFFWDVYGLIFYAVIFILSITMLFMIVIHYMFPSYFEHILSYVKIFLILCDLLILPMAWDIRCHYWGGWWVDKELKSFYFLTFLALIAFCFSLCLCLPISFTVIAGLIIFLEELVILALTCESLAIKEFSRNWGTFEEFYEAWEKRRSFYDDDISDIHYQDRNTIAPWCCFLAIFIIILLGPLVWALIAIYICLEAYRGNDGWQILKDLYNSWRLPITGPSQDAKQWWEAKIKYVKVKVNERVEACEHAAFNAYVKALNNAAEIGVYKTPEAYKGAIAMAIYAAEKAGATNEEANKIAKKTHLFNRHIPIAKAGAISTEVAQNSFVWISPTEIELKKRVEKIWIDVQIETSLRMPGIFN